MKGDPLRYGDLHSGHLRPQANVGERPQAHEGERPQASVGGERPQASERPRAGDVSLAREPNVYVGDSSVGGWFPDWQEGDTITECWEDNGFFQLCVMWHGLSLGKSRTSEAAMIEALEKFPDAMPVMWMLTPTVEGVNLDAVPDAHNIQKNQRDIWITMGRNSSIV